MDLLQQWFNLPAKAIIGTMEAQRKSFEELMQIWLGKSSND